MADFFYVAARPTKRGVTEIYPKFLIKRSQDLMIRGGDFYAVWLDDKGLWSTDEQDALRLIDDALDKYAEEKRSEIEGSVRVLHLWDAESGMIDIWHKYCQRQLRDNFVMLDENVIFSNTPTSRETYASKKLDYPLEDGSIRAYDKLMSTLYSESERHKIEWSIGAIVTGDSKDIQKFMVLYGAVGTGKSTVINIIEKLFNGYYAVFDAKSLGSSSNAFALEAFRSNPLVAIQHDGDLSRIEDNTRLNSLVSHELMTVNEKFKSAYSNRFKCFLIMGTNKPVKITDGKSGLIRRLIDVSPSGNKLSPKEYKECVSQINFELGAIAYHCKEVYLDDKNAYDDYIPTAMLGASNDFYNFVEDSYIIFERDDETTLKSAFERYKTFCADANVPYPVSQRIFREELKNYFHEYYERSIDKSGNRVRNLYKGFAFEKFDDILSEKPKEETKDSWINLNCTESLLDDILADCPAQYATEDGKPSQKWDDVKEKLCDLNTSKLHYVRVPLYHIVIDFDIPDENGEKSLEKNIEAASKFPPTYAEVSKSGKGLHLHYIYKGDPLTLSRIYDEHIEIKVYNGKSSLRRLCSKCNDIPIAEISSGLPTKGEGVVADIKQIKSEKALRILVCRNLNKEIHPGTKPSMDFIKKILDDAYNSGLCYDISDMKSAIIAFAAKSTHQADYCLKLINDIRFKSEVESSSNDSDKSDDVLTFYDVEVFPNLFLVNYKHEGANSKVVRMINPTPHDIEGLIRFKLVGFNCRRYDNHILYARLMGYSNEELYKLSQRIISGDRKAFFGEAYNLSYTDVYDFSSKKQSLKKFEIELGITHRELGLPWDQPVPEERWVKVAEYCDNDVIATEAVFNARNGDWTARKILADIAGGSVNDTTNSLSAKFIFGKEKHPQSAFNYRNMGDTSIPHYTSVMKDGVLYSDIGDPDYTLFDEEGRPIFPGYKFENGKSTYRGEEVGEGGNVYAEPGIYENVALLDIASMHPSSTVAENLFGDVYTQRFKDILDARIAIKHGDFGSARQMLGGKLAPYLNDESNAGDLAQALKIVINSVYGLTSAKFDNAFRDIRNIDNIVAKRGALFMINLKHEVQKKGFTVAHIKTDSIKIPNATPEIIEFVMTYGKMYGYNFEHEATYEKMCLVNDSVYVAKYATTEFCESQYGYIPEKNAKKPGKWTATGTQFKVPYVFKTLFSHEPIEFKDMCETNSVATAMYLDMDENLPEGEHDYIFVGKVGSFCPIKEGHGGGTLVREKDGKYHAVGGSKGYRWLESTLVKELNKEDSINRNYYISLVDKAYDAIAEYGDAEAFLTA